MYEFGIYSTYFLGSEVPGYITCRKSGSTIAVIVPSSLSDHPNTNKILGLNVSFVWRPQFRLDYVAFVVVVTNDTKDVQWLYEYLLPDFPDCSLDYVWLSMWKCGGLLEDGDRFRVCIILAEEDYELNKVVLEGEVKEIGVRIIYEDDLMMADNVTSEEEDHCPSETTIRWSDKLLVEFSDHHASGSTYCFSGGNYSSLTESNSSGEC